MKTGKICASVGAKTCADAVSLVKKAELDADLVEIRFDHLAEGEIPKLLAFLRDGGFSKPIIATYRPHKEGGKGPDEIEDRLKFWRQSGELFWAVDLEEDIFEMVNVSGKKIPSYHDYGNGDGYHSNAVERLRGYGADIVKYAYMADDITDSLAVFQMLGEAQHASQPIVLIAMGEAGMITRLLGPAYGSSWTYGSAGDITAPGQVACRDLEEVYRVSQITRETTIFGVIGDPVALSRSPNIHNAAFSESEIDAVFLPLTVKDLNQFIVRMVRPSSREIDLNFGGFAVTMPHKLSIVGHLDEIDDIAAEVGAVNTIKVDGERLLGFNTDAEGFLQPLKMKCGSLRGASAAVFGSGGAARACLYALQREGVRSTVLARDTAKAEDAVGKFGADVAGIGSRDIGDFDIVVNATPVGMAGQTSEISLDGIERVQVVYDLVTSSEPTPFIRAAEQAGVDSISGIEMLIAQAEKQFEIWTGKAAPRDIMKEAAHRTARS